MRDINEAKQMLYDILETYLAGIKLGIITCYLSLRLQIFLAGLMIYQCSRLRIIDSI